MAGSAEVRRFVVLDVVVVVVEGDVVVLAIVPVLDAQG